MSNCTRYLGLDVHAETITAAIAEGRGQIRSLGKFPNRPEATAWAPRRLHLFPSADIPTPGSRDPGSWGRHHLVCR